MLLLLLKVVIEFGLGSQFTTGTQAINPNEWQHIALVRTRWYSKSFYKWIDEDFSVSDTNNRNGTAQRDHGIGANYSGVSKFDGLLYDWRVTNSCSIYKYLCTTY